MNWRSTVVLVLIALIAIAALYFGVLKTDESAALPTPAFTAAPTRAPMFPGVKAEQVQSLGVQQTGGNSLLLVRGPDGVWRITQGVVSQTVALPAPADPERVGAAVQQLTSLVPAYVLTQAADPKSLGLDNPAVVITFTATSGVTGTLELHTLRIGKEPVAGAGYYAYKDSDGLVYVISTSVVNTLLDYAKAAPVQPTPTPSPTPSVTPTPGGTEAPSTAPGETPPPVPPATLAPGP